MEYTQFEITVASDYEDIICAFLIKAGSPSVAVDDPSLVPPKEGCIDKREEIPEQTGNVMITADFDSDIPDIENIVKDFLSNLSICHELKISKLEKKDWNLEWKKHFKGIEIENLLKIVPPWQEITGTSLINVIINPGEGFGTGTHVTTRY
jgi:ribosomal protein L11 methylase PrmA